MTLNYVVHIYLGRTHRWRIALAQSPYMYAIAPTAPAIHHSPHLVTARQSPRKVRSPDSDSIPVILARAGQKKLSVILYTSKGRWWLESVQQALARCGIARVTSLRGLAEPRLLTGREAHHVPLQRTPIRFQETRDVT